MKRFHVHVSVKDVPSSIRFYSTLFAAQPVVVKSDYAKWMLEDPRVNFAISSRNAEVGVRHLGIQVENGAELSEVYERLQRADRPVLEEGQTTCCYAKSEKSWIEDPQGVQWETFLTTGESTVYGNDLPAAKDPLARTEKVRSSSPACCVPSGCAPGAWSAVGSLVTAPVAIYHNPDCGTSRNTLAMIRNAGIEPVVIHYLQEPPSRDQLKSMIAAAGLSVREALREKGTPFKQLGLDNPALTDDQLLDAMLAHPILINRPFVVTEKGTRLCRPSEVVLDILPQSQRGAFAKEDGEVVVDDQGRRVG